MILIENIFQYKTLKKIKDIINFIDSYYVNNHILEWGFIGGIPRDFLINEKPLKINEIDIIFYHPVETFILNLVDKFKDIIEKYYYHPQFLTAKIIFKNSINLDLITSRKEYYPYPSCLPKIQYTNNFKEDILRRDITINTILFKRNHKHKDFMFTIIDLLDGIKDLKNRECKILHKLSFVDDPTRIYRIFRYKARYNLSFNKETQEALNNSISYIKMLSKNRIYNEIKKINQEKKFDKVYEEFFNLNIDPFNGEAIKENNFIKYLNKDLKILRKSIISFEKFFINQKNKIEHKEINKLDKNIIILSFFLNFSNSYLANSIQQNFKDLIGKSIYSFCELWEKTLNIIKNIGTNDKKNINSKILKKIYLEHFDNTNINSFIVLLFLLFKLKRKDLKFIVKGIFKRKFVNPLKLNPQFVESVIKYYSLKEELKRDKNLPDEEKIKNLLKNTKKIEITTIKEIIKKTQNMYILGKINTMNQAIRFIKKISKKYK